MVKRILFLSILFLNTWQAGAQCVPDTGLTGSNIYYAPQGSQNYRLNGEEIIILPYAYPGYTYSEILQFKIPEETSYMGLSANIDYIKLQEVFNLPPEYTLSCVPSGDCQFPGGTYGCAELSGIGGSPDSVELSIAIEVKFSTPGGGSGTGVDTLRNIYLVTKGGIGTGEIPTPENVHFYPNPAGDKGFLSFVPTSPNVEIRITNIIGKLIYSRKYSTQSGKNTVQISLQNYAPGIYFYSLKDNGREMSGRFIVTD